MLKKRWSRLLFWFGGGGAGVGGGRVAGVRGLFFLACPNQAGKTWFSFSQFWVKFD